MAEHHPGPPDRGTLPEWMLGDDEHSQCIVLVMKVRVAENAVPGSETRLLNDHFLIGNAVTLALGPTDAAKVQGSKEAKGTRYILRTKYKSISEKLMQIRELPDKTPIEITEHPTLNTVQGVVFEPDSIGHSGDYIRRNLESQGVCYARHMKKSDGKELRNTGLIVLTFKGTVLPKFVYFGRLRVSVRCYYPSPLMCFRCANFGHASKNCDTKKHPQVCLTCSGNHSVVQGAKCSLPAFCKNCDQDHPPISKRCPIYRAEEAIIRLKIDRGLSYSEARAEYRKTSGGTSISSVIQDRLRVEETDKDRTIKLLQNQVASLQKTVAMLQAQIASGQLKPTPKETNERQSFDEATRDRTKSTVSSNKKSKDFDASKSSTQNDGQSVSHLGTSGPVLKNCYVDLTPMGTDQRAGKNVKDTSAQSSKNSKNDRDFEEMDFELVKNNKRKGNKKGETPESPERKKGSTTGYSTPREQSTERPR